MTLSAQAQTRLRAIEEKTASVASATHYEVLGISRDATLAGIKSGYASMVKQFHPDVHRSEDLGSETARRLGALIIKIRNAYETLADPSARAEYDKRLPPAPPAPKAPPPSAPAPPAANAKAEAQEREKTKASTATSAPVNDKPEAQTPKEAPPKLPPPSPQAMARVRYRVGVGHFDEADYHSAVENLREAVRLAPDKAQYHHMLARALAKNPKWRKQTETHLLRVVELVPYETSAYLDLARLYEDSQLPMRAKKMYAKILEIDPDHEIALASTTVSDDDDDSLRTRILRKFRRSSTSNDELTKTTIVSDA